MAARTITFGDVAENGPGMEHIGSMCEKGLTEEELVAAQVAFENARYECELIDLCNEDLIGFDITKCNYNSSIPLNSAKLLIIRKGVELLAKEDASLVNEEQESLEPDKHAWMRGQVKNKRARWNLCFADEAQDPDYQNKKGTIVSFSSLPILNKIRENLPIYFGERTRNLNAELNVYYDPAKCGIGFHGDAERNITIGMRLGTNIPFEYQWFLGQKPIGNRIKLEFQEGDIYAMGAKAIGTDWKRSVVPTLRHAAGSKNYLKITREPYNLELLDM